MSCKLKATCTGWLGQSQEVVWQSECDEREVAMNPERHDSLAQYGESRSNTRTWPWVFQQNSKRAATSAALHEDRVYSCEYRIYCVETIKTNLQYQDPCTPIAESDPVWLYNHLSNTLNSRTNSRNFQLILVTALSYSSLSLVFSLAISGSP